MIRVKNNENVSVAVKVIDLQNTTAMCFMLIVPTVLLNVVNSVCVVCVTRFTNV